MEDEKNDSPKKLSKNKRAFVTSRLRVEDALREAQRRAEKLLEELSRQRGELDAPNVKVPEEQRTAGRQALERAAESARNMLKRIDEALGGQDRERDRGQS